ncbi:MAG: hypothetical protein JWQ94_2742 [Tardiphaga sp.]|jgi:hypothetical protein|nr:hypothetical protein [Tardiphaga sp.]
MSAATHAPSFQIEDLLHSYGEVLSARRSQDRPARKASGFDGRSLAAGFIAFFIFAPGCAAATAFLFASKERLPPLQLPDRYPPSIAKADRLPPTLWRSAVAGSPNSTSSTTDDASFLAAVAIRGRLDETVLVGSANEVATPVVVTSVSTRTTRKYQIRRGKPINLVAEVVATAPAPQPSLIEKLFASRNP